ncbi:MULTISPECIES: YrhB domain-containing protein [unclassified Duganella]|uniref:YrhB domain-containing protein n=1 Tax=unclassified Duganella TaxID=2636909 RepID=UPI0013140C8D|nr:MULTISPECIES: YrhB domain-containing protein [unclassified Duganella]
MSVFEGALCQDVARYLNAVPILEDKLMSSISDSNALKVAEAKVHELGAASGDEFEILHAETREVEQGWVFFYNSADFVQTRNPLSALAGNGPILVLRDGRVAVLPTSMPWQEAVTQLPLQEAGWAA